MFTGARYQGSGHSNMSYLIWLLVCAWITCCCNSWWVFHVLFHSDCAVNICVHSSPGSINDRIMYVIIQGALVYEINSKLTVHCFWTQKVWMNTSVFHYSMLGAVWHIDMRKSNSWWLGMVYEREACYPSNRHIFKNCLLIETEELI